MDHWLTDLTRDYRWLSRSDNNVNDPTVMSFFVNRRAMDRLFCLLVFVVPCLTKPTAEPVASDPADQTPSEGRQQPDDYEHFDPSNAGNDPRFLGTFMGLSSGLFAPNTWDGNPYGAGYDPSTIQQYGYVGPNYGGVPASVNGYGQGTPVGINNYGSYGAIGSGPGFGYQSGYACGSLCGEHLRRCDLACSKNFWTYSCAVCVGPKWDDCRPCFAFGNGVGTGSFTDYPYRKSNSEVSASTEPPVEAAEAQHLPIPGTQNFYPKTEGQERR